ncbi:SMC-Scp complex subunit ScpB [Roseimaritima sediminicola]|uniref:SMC-Scp complex subunit ScpB n=1 Tax=Roseimaritima sediminicola TaxID=2662066 RepID=UPI001298273F|nr:SMC-Scp complex subunit ScpB [Roseimaritima sediminicola]
MTDDQDWEGVSLEELGAAYAKVMAESGAAEGTEPAADDDPQTPATDEAAQTPQVDAEQADGPVTIEGIVEAALFVGHPENQRLTAKQIAGMIRNVSPREVEEIVDQLNSSYAEAGQAIRIETDSGGLQMVVAPQLETVRRAFYGKVREAHLSLGAVEVLALVAYQPGITAQRVQDQRGKESGALLNQMVRRQLLRVERVKPEDGGRPVATYYPTDRFLHLFQLSSLEDLPQVEEEGNVV